MELYVDRRTIDEFVTRIRELQIEAGRATGPNAAAVREDKSLSALAFAGRLVDLLCRWAIHPEAETTTDGSNDVDPVTRRRHLARLLHPFGLFDLSEALKALDFGEVQPLLKPVNVGLHGHAYTLWRCRLGAVQHVAFRYAADGNRTRAEEIVSGAYGCSPETIDSWRKRGLPRQFGASTVQHAVGMATHHGKLKIKLQKRRFSGEDTQIERDLYEAIYGDTTLMRHAAEYKATLSKSIRKRKITPLKPR